MPFAGIGGTILIIDDGRVLAGRAARAARRDDANRPATVRDIANRIAPRRLGDREAVGSGVHPDDAEAFLAPFQPGCLALFRNERMGHQHRAVGPRKPVDHVPGEGSDVALVEGIRFPQDHEVRAVCVQRDEPRHRDQQTVVAPHPPDCADQPLVGHELAAPQALIAAVSGGDPPRLRSGGEINRIEDRALADARLDERDAPAIRRQGDRLHALARSERGGRVKIRCRSRGLRLRLSRRAPRYLRYSNGNRSGCCVQHQLHRSPLHFYLCYRLKVAETPP